MRIATSAINVLKILFDMYCLNLFQSGFPFKIEWVGFMSLRDASTDISTGKLSESNLNKGS